MKTLLFAMTVSALLSAGCHITDFVADVTPLPNGKLHVKKCALKAGAFSSVYVTGCKHTVLDLETGKSTLVTGIQDPENE